VSSALLAGVLLASRLAGAPEEAQASRWTAARAHEWCARHPVPLGCNYLPADAVNQLEMWQASTFDLKRIDLELGWAHGVGFNAVRVFLHDIAWREDPQGFLDRVDQFLEVARRHKISVLFVVFDGVWNPFPHAGPQPAPTPGVHNSQWVQSPGVVLLTDGATHGGLEAYVKTLLSRFRDDPRILGWDLFNEPDNDNARSYRAQETPDKGAYSLILLREAFAWAREVGPSQPLTAGVWHGDWDLGALDTSPVTRFELENSDVISYHCYDPLPAMEQRVAELKRLGRPLWCTEYMARPKGSRFQTILPFLYPEGIGAFCWGFVAGKSQTRYAWDTWKVPEAGEPNPWFHDVLHFDGTPYDPAEVEFLRTLPQRAGRPTSQIPALGWKKFQSGVIVRLSPHLIS
jgi:hypothetical protein